MIVNLGRRSRNNESARRQHLILINNCFYSERSTTIAELYTGGLTEGFKTDEVDSTVPLTSRLLKPAQREDYCEGFLSSAQRGSNACKPCIGKEIGGAKVICAGGLWWGELDEAGRARLYYFE